MFVLLFFAVALAALALRDLPDVLRRRRVGRDQFDLDAFFESGRASGASLAEISDELQLREAFATTRRLASDAVLAQPAAFVSILDREKAAAVRRLGETRKDLAKRLGRTLADLPMNHVLYRDAMAAVERLPQPVRDFYLTTDRAAALRVVPPA